MQAKPVKSRDSGVIALRDNNNRSGPKRNSSAVLNCNEKSLMNQWLLSNQILEPHPQALIIPHPLRSGRYLIRFQDNGLRWDLPLSLSRNESDLLLEILQAVGLSFELNQQDNGPIEAELVHAITEQFVESEFEAFHQC